MHTIANGADGVFFFPWKRFPFGSEQNHGAITDFDGRPTRIYYECQAIGERLQRLSEALEGSMVVSEIAVLYDFPSRWHIEHPSDWSGHTGVYILHINKLYHSVRKLGHNCDAVSRYGDFTPYKLLLVPMLPIIDDELVHKLQQYAEGGGVIVFHPLSGIKNEEATYYKDRLHPGMLSLLGIHSLETATSGTQTEVQFSWQNRLYKGDMLHELVQIDSADVAGSFANQWYKGYPAVTKHPFGTGHAWFIATFAEESFYLDFLTERCNELRVPKLLGITPPAPIEMTMRQQADGETYTFVINSSRDSATLDLDRRMYDVWNNEWFEGSLPITPYGVRILIEPSHPLGKGARAHR